MKKGVKKEGRTEEETGWLETTRVRIKPNDMVGAFKGTLRDPLEVKGPLRAVEEQRIEDTRQPFEASRFKA